MIRHIVAWNFKEGFSDTENEDHARKVKTDLEALTNIVDGILEINVRIDLLSSSNKQVVLDSCFACEDAMAAYQVHPEHKKVVAFINEVFENRICIDYLEPKE
ncbi:hypothetical protein M2140_001633 [Clostridiales Family XIII bacterium PM5-7]